MQLELDNVIRPGVYQVNLTGVDAKRIDLLRELIEQPWQPEVVTRQVQANERGTGGRFNLQDLIRGEYDVSRLTGKIMREIYEGCRTDEFRKSMIRILYQNDLFKRIWAMPPELLFKRTTSWGYWVKDEQKTTVELHLDNRTIVCSGMIYFVNTHNEDITTRFYTDPNRSNEVSVKTGWQTGWIAPNTHDSWHEGGNRSVTDRYALLLGLSIDWRLIDEK
jgi:hypothetical protein